MTIKLFVRGSSTRTPSDDKTFLTAAVNPDPPELPPEEEPDEESVEDEDDDDEDDDDEESPELEEDPDDRVDLIFEESTEANFNR